MIDLQFFIDEFNCCRAFSMPSMERRVVPFCMMEMDESSSEFIEAKILNALSDEKIHGKHWRFRGWYRELVSYQREVIQLHAS